MYLRVFCLFLLFFYSCQNVVLRGQPVDSATVSKTVKLSDIEVVGYLQPQQRWKTPASVGIINEGNLEKQSVESLVPAINTIPGVRMEERSPGSYRLSIRGSLVRSPYGVRNVKIYYNDFALTDAGGVVLLHSNASENNVLKLKGYGGSYGLAGEALYLAKNSGKHFWTLRQSFQRSDGYRHNSGNYRLFVQLSNRWQYTTHNHLEAYAFYADLDYRTPGGLTKEQYDEDPRQSRPATATMPGSAEQKTRISTPHVLCRSAASIKLVPMVKAYAGCLGQSCRLCLSVYYQL